MEPNLETMSPNNRALFDWWKGRFRGDRLPTRDAVDPIDLAPFLPDLWLVDLVGERKRPRFRLVGTRVDRVAGRRLTGLWVDEVWPRDPDALDKPESRLHRLVVDRLACHYHGPPRFISNPEVATVDLLHLPLCGATEDVDHVLVQSCYFTPSGSTYRKTVLAVD